MASYHILTASKNGNVLTVVMHIAVPDANNLVGENYRTILALLHSDFESQVLNITPEELASIVAGELVEESIRFTTHPGETLVQKRDRLDTLYGLAVTRVQAEWQQRLSCYGFEREVP